MGHELGHWKLSHTVYGVAISLSNLCFLFYLFSFTMDRADIVQSFYFTDYLDQN